MLKLWHFDFYHSHKRTNMVFLPNDGAEMRQINF